MGATFDPLLGRLRTTDTGGSGSGDVTHTGTLTAHEVILGNGGADIKALGSVGSLGQVLTSGGAGVDPSWAAAGSGTIGGSIAVNQIAFGSGVNTITGSSSLTWTPGSGGTLQVVTTEYTLSQSATVFSILHTPTNAEIDMDTDGAPSITPAVGERLTINGNTFSGGDITFGSGDGVVFEGVAAPITVVGGARGSDTAIIFDNIPDGYVLLVFDQYTDIEASQGLAIADTAGASFSVDGAGGAFVAGAVIGITGTTSVDVGGLTRITPKTTRTGLARISSDIFSGSTEFNVLHFEQFGQADSGTDKFESSIILGGTNATPTEKEITSLGAEGHYTALGVLTNYEMFWYDAVRAGSILRIDSVTDATRLQVGADYRFDVVRNITSEADVIAGTTSLLDTATLAWLGL